MNEHVSVLIYTFNQDKYIEQAILSVLAQKTNFKYHLYIVDDASVDNTATILKKIKAENPENITLFINTKNLGQKKNSINIINKLNSKYFAVLDGDDFWTFEDKLQKQVDFLNQNEEYNACFHDLLIQTEDDIYHAKHSNKSKSFFKTYSQINNYTEEVYSYQIINRLIPPISSIIFKTEKVKEAYKEILNDKKDFRASFGWVFCLFIIKDSKFYYFNETWAVYRDHSKGITKYFANNHFIEPVIYYLKKILVDPSFKNLKTHIYSSLAENTYYLISNSKNMSLLTKKVSAIKIIYYRMLQGFYKVIELNKGL